MTHDLEYLAREDFCYLTTTRRISGRPHRHEVKERKEDNNRRPVPS